MGGLTGVRAVCWDWNGTLLDDVDVCRDVMNSVLTERGIPPLADAEAYRSAFRYPIRGFYQDLGIDEHRFEAAAIRYLALLAERTGEAPLHLGARQTLSGLAGLGIRQVLASATHADLLAAQMAPHDLDGAFEAVLSIDDALRPSKHDVVERWLAGSGLQAAEVLMIGDTNHDEEIASALGVAFVHHSGGHQRLVGTSTRIAALPELIELLRS